MPPVRSSHFEENDDELQNFLSNCKSDWGSKELRDVQRKLAAVGIFHPLQLLDRVKSGVVNDHLRAAGEKCFTGHTLEAMRAAGTRLDPLGAARVQTPYPLLGSADVTSSGQGDETDEDDMEMVRCAFGLPGLGNKAHMTPLRGRCTHDSHLDVDGPALSSIAGQISAGFARFEKVTSQAKRRNREVVEGLVGVQEDISRIAGKMQAARVEREQRQQSRRSSCPASAPSAASHGPRKANGVSATSARGSAYAAREEFLRSPQPLYTERPQGAGSNPIFAQGRFTAHRPMSRSSAFSGDFPESTRGQNRTPVPPPRRPTVENPCARGARGGFTFGGQSKSSHGTPGRGSGPMLLESVPSAAPGLPEDVRRSVHAELLSARRSSREDQKSVVKRLLVAWHPDRNPESTELATAVFQYIQQERDRLMDN